jgi:hypothetical protein
MFLINSQQGGFIMAVLQELDTQLVSQLTRYHGVDQLFQSPLAGIDRPLFISSLLEWPKKMTGILPV